MTLHTSIIVGKVTLPRNSEGIRTKRCNRSAGLIKSMERKMPKTDHASTTSARWPASSVQPPSHPKPLPVPPHGPAKPSRRGVMLATAKLLVLGGAVAGASAAEAAPVPGNPDSDLIAMCDRIVAAHQEIERAESPYYNEPCSPSHVRARTSLLVAEGHRLSEAVAEMEALTPEGVRAKARAMLTYIGYDIDERPIWSNHDELLGWSIARDLLRGA